MILSTVRRILKEDLAKTGEIPAWVDALLTPLNQFVDLVTLAFRNNLNFKDNFACKQLSLSFVHNTETTVSPGTNQQVIGVFPISSDVTGLTTPKDAQITGFGWYRKQNNQLSVTVNFAGGSSTTRKCTIVVLLG